MKKYQKRLMCLLACIMALSVLLVLAAGLAADDLQVVINGQQDNAKVWQVFRLVNQERGKVGAGPLQMDANLMEWANQRAAECAYKYYNKDGKAHFRPNGTAYNTIWKQSVGHTGENLAFGYTSANSVMVGWMNSDGHKGNILNATATRIGIGCYVHDGAYYWVQLFDTGTKVTKAQETSTVSTAKRTIQVNNDSTDLSADGKTTIELKTGESKAVIIQNENDLQGWKNYTVLEPESFTYTTTNKYVAVW